MWSISERCKINTNWSQGKKNLECGIFLSMVFISVASFGFIFAHISNWEGERRQFPTVSWDWGKDRGFVCSFLSAFWPFQGVHSFLGWKEGKKDWLKFTVPDRKFTEILEISEAMWFYQVSK